LLHAIDEQVSWLARLEAELRDQVELAARLSRAPSRRCAVSGHRRHHHRRRARRHHRLTTSQLAAFPAQAERGPSGERRRLGGITKAGKRPRIAAFTATATPEVRTDIATQLGFASPVLHVRRFDLPWEEDPEANRRFRRMLARGKNPNVVVTAIAREMAAFMWAIAREVPLNA
jgi:hypothetical protein